MIVRLHLVLRPCGAQEAGLDSIVVGFQILYGGYISPLTFRAVSEAAS